MFNQISPFSNLQTQNDYLREWVPKRESYIDILLDSEALPAFGCGSCGADGQWRCDTCFGQPLFCAACCRTQHRNLPFHRVKYWDGTHFSSSWLRHIGVEIYLGHGGLPCPTTTENLVDDNASEYSSDEEDPGEAAEFPDELWETAASGMGPTIGLKGAGSSSFDASQGNLTTIVDTTGVHQLFVNVCSCVLNPEPPDVQFMRMGLFPASFQRVCTAFTFRVLDDYRLDNLESKTTAYKYYNKLRRRTAPAFPHSVKVCQTFAQCTSTKPKVESLP